MTEEWRDIAGYEGIYQVSNLGHVRRLPHTTVAKNGVQRVLQMRYMKTPDAGKGYRCIGLFKNGKQTSYRLCRVVATAFCDNPNNYPIVNHKDCDVTNDCADNLEWCNHSYNNTYAGASQRRGDMRARPVDQYTASGEFVRHWKSIAEAQRTCGIGNIWSVCSNKRTQAGNFIWKFSNNNF